MCGSTYLEAVEEVEETPGDDDVVVECHKERDNAGGDADAAEPGMDCVPHSKGTQPHPLSDTQFNEEQWDSLENQHYHEWDEESTCGNKEEINHSTSHTINQVARRVSCLFSTLINPKITRRWIGREKSFNSILSEAQVENFAGLINYVIRKYP